MNTTTLKGQWHQLKGEVKNRWSKLTDDDLGRIEGNAEKLAGVIQERYGYAKERAEEEVRQWEREHPTGV